MKTRISLFLCFAFWGCSSEPVPSPIPTVFEICLKVVYHLSDEPLKGAEIEVLFIEGEYQEGPDCPNLFCGGIYIRRHYSTDNSGTFCFSYKKNWTICDIRIKGTDCGYEILYLGDCRSTQGSKGVDPNSLSTIRVCK